MLLQKQNCTLKPKCTRCITQCGYTPVSPSSVDYLQSPLIWPFTINCNDFNITFTGSHIWIQSAKKDVWMYTEQNLSQRHSATIKSLRWVRGVCCCPWPDPTQPTFGTSTQRHYLAGSSCQHTQDHNKPVVTNTYDLTSQACSSDCLGNVTAVSSMAANWATCERSKHNIRQLSDSNSFCSQDTTWKFYIDYIGCKSWWCNIQ
jgi:hypothetical protein